MISVEEIKRKATNKFLAYLKSIIKNDLTFFPLLIPSAKGSVKDAIEFREAKLKQLYKYSKQARDQGYTVKTKLVKTRSRGEQTIIEEIFFETEKDFLVFIQKEKDVIRFKKNLATVKNKFNNFAIDKTLQTKWLIKQINNLLNKNEDNFWENIFICADWFCKNENCNLYLREIPLQIHTKFIEQNRNLIFSLYTLLKELQLTSNISTEFIYNTWGVRCSMSFVRIRILDKKININILDEKLDIDEVQIPLDTFSRLKFNSVQNIFIVENLMVYLTFPRVPKSICIFGSGFKVVQFKENKNLTDKKIFYFGDIDEHGFEILSDVRNNFPNVKSFCMDDETYNKFSNFAVRGKSSMRIIEELNLKPDEFKLFIFLKNNPQCNRLEQERITQSFIKEKLKREINLESHS